MLLYDENGNVIGDDGDASTDSIPVTSSWGGENFDAARRGIAHPDSGFIAGKIAEFQTAIDNISGASDDLHYMQSLPISESDAALIADKLSELESRKTAFRYAANALNFATGIVNNMGGSMPEVRIPSGLGFAVLGLPLAEAAAIAGAAALVIWGTTWIASTHSIALSAAENLPEPHRTAALERLSKTQQHNAISDSIAGAASIVKWIVIGGALYFAYTTFVEKKRGN